MEERLELAVARLRELIGELAGQKEDTNTEKTLPGDWRDFFVVQIGLLLKLCEVAETIAAALKQLGLPSQISENLEITELNRAVLQDKKNSGTHLNLLVIDEAGKISLKQKSIKDLIWR